MYGSKLWAIKIKCFVDNFLPLVQVTSSMAGVVRAMESALKSMNLEKVGVLFF